MAIVLADFPAVLVILLTDLQAILTLSWPHDCPGYPLAALVVLLVSFLSFLLVLLVALILLLISLLIGLVALLDGLLIPLAVV